MYIKQQVLFISGRKPEMTAGKLYCNRRFYAVVFVRNSRLIKT